VLFPVLPPETREFLATHLAVAEGVLADSGPVLSSWPNRVHEVPGATPGDGCVRIELRVEPSPDPSSV
jgi:hypothetical protein